MFKEIAKTTAPRELFASYPPASCREEWEAIPKDYRNALIEEGDQWLGCQFPPIYATDFMDFGRTGNRGRYEDKLFSRRTILNALVLAECAQYEGRYLDAILNGIFLICGEAAWQLPAHNTYIRDTPQLLLPDVTRPVLDLFAAETGAVLAMAEYLLREAFEKVSPAISVLVNHNLKTRIFDPYLREHFWWMGDGSSPMNNWTSWCTQNVLLAAFTRPLPSDTQKAIMDKACGSLDYFLDEYGEDGCCDEGAQYYGHAGLTLFGAMEILNQVSGQAFERLYREPKIVNIGDYIRKVHVAGPYYVNFADCSPMAGNRGSREYLFGKRAGNEALMAFAAEDYQRQTEAERLNLEEHNLLYRVWGAFFHKEMMNYRKEKPEEAGDCYFPSAGLFVARDSRFCLAVKAGDNGDSHNHNDVGSFTVYRDGQPMFIDAGVESYSKKTFSPQRYEIWTMRSQYHNLPSFGDMEQMAGEEFAASDVMCELGQEKAWIQMELAGAYPKGCVTSYVRHVCLEKGREIRITDICQGNREQAVLSLMTDEKPGLVWEQGICHLDLGSLGRCRIEGAAQAQVQEIPITDSRLKIAWHHNIFRILVTFEGHRLVLVIPEDG